MRKAKTEGFSLIEIVVVLVIMSLAAVLVTPSITGTLRQMEVRSAAKRISAIFRFWRNEAINKNKICRIVFEPESRKLTVFSAGQGEERFGAVRSYPLPDRIRFEIRETGRRLSESSEPVFEFYPTGGASGGTIVVGSADSSDYAVKIDFLTGAVRVEAIEEK